MEALVGAPRDGSHTVDDLGIETLVEELLEGPRGVFHDIVKQRNHLATR